ncbi:TRAP-type C4-dicarboxylate transport system permease small subunit [Palleronia aestuarii]|uniref:TRAP transporter small permease protein n=1 Tax=Palleronia aestuarii TaxID=568105 RepID=A0A2W7Q5N8_9RHOB|nr:TRAP transporter small permease subunit [Palleronia aestuarii]PZX17039.1 TRAP-type C4-dicarboxylate transport system permease small subunit [Palleronia aestuarii]
MATGRHRAIAVIRACVTIWALLGGAVLLGIVGVNVASVVGAAFLGRPLPGVYEIVQMGAAIAMFMALPYCQITGSNVTADIFTSRLPRRGIVTLAALGAALALAFASFLLWRMWYGLDDARAYGEVTAIYQIPVWFAYVPILLSLALMALAALANLLQTSGGILPEEVDASRDRHV